MDKTFEEIRGEILAEAREKEENIIKRWLTEIGCQKTETVGYYFNLGEKKAEIFSTHPGVLIGVGGVGVDKFKNILSEEFGGEWSVNFIVVRGGFVNMNRD